MRRALAIGLLVLAGAAGIRAWQAAQGEPFKAAIELVRVDFLAVGTNGEPIPDLAQADLTLKVDGRAREIRSFQYVRLDSRASGRQRSVSTAPAEPFGTNVLNDAGRTVLIIFDTDSIRANIAQQATSAAVEFVGGLSPRDWVGLVTMPYGGVVTELTRDHARVIQALPTISGRASQQTTDSDKSCRSRDTLNALVGQLESLVRLEGPKTIVFVSSGMLLPRRDAPLSSAPGPCEIRPVQYEQVGRAASLARTHVYVVRPDELVIDSARNAFANPSASRFQSTDEEVAGLESLAGVTNGVLLRLTPTDRSAFDRITRESSGYYLVGFEPRAGERNGAYHRVDVDSAKSDARIKTLPYLMMTKDEVRKPAVTPTAILRDPKLHTDLALRVVGFSSPNPGDSKLTVIGLVEPFDPNVTLSSAVFGLIDTRGRLVAQWTPSPRELSSKPVTSAGLVSPGRYRLRVAAIDSTGRRGSADYDLSAELVSAGGLTFSTMVLGVSYERSFVARLQFSREPTANGYFEIFGEPPSGTLSLAMELAESIDGPALARVPGAIAPLPGTDRRRATGVVPIAQVAPGDYVLRAVVSLDGKPLTTLTRALRKVAP